ncbi:TPA: DUF3696 domain-containing protein [Salmonella enterica subsp. salamae serovar 9,46:z4,z24:z39:z42]|nr:DUF3696 domain-containing protein [Salmonella enterica subsp. salamae serovar 9,46:z4,z24:z39:z42]HCM1955922.1 DUF3696 domain-containing protein [Salmonella enterica subsp. salamae serovar 9,46:z4,z24:z39:z42]
MLMIETLKLKNFKAYKDQTFNFTNLTVFCGNNSVGKSTAVQAIGMFLQTNFLSGSSLKINGDLVHIGSVDDIHNYDRRKDDELLIDISSSEFDACWGYGTDGVTYRDNLPNKNELPFIANEKTLHKLKFFSEKNINFQYLDAERYGPRDNMPLSNHNYHQNWLGKQGEYTIEVLEGLFNKRLTLLNENGTNQEDPRRHVNSSSANVFQNIELWMQEISPGHKILPRVENSANVAFNSIITEDGQHTKPINIGFGYTYSLSIVSALLLAEPNDLVVIENPEAHLHPRGQSYLGRLIALAAQAGIQVIIETHSDHLLNGIRIISKIREGFSPELFTLYYISKDRDDTKVVKIDINNEGKLSEWPEGFFDQQSLDMYTLMTGMSPKN